VTDSVPVMLVTELMVNGDLRKLLRACRPHKVEHRVTVVTETNMATMAAKMASAMAFLERRSILHRDLAARNILVGAIPSDVKLAVSDESHLVLLNILPENIHSRV
jgi:serine/threonine protein kinase